MIFCLSITSSDLLGMMSKPMNPHILDQGTLKEIFEMRLVQEIGMADLIFKRITKKDIPELKKIVSNEPPVTKFYLFNIDHEIAFHGKLYEIPFLPSIYFAGYYLTKKRPS
ncbi:MAG: hypothetical protein ABI691_13835 [Ginsengibacter sp.]